MKTNTLLRRTYLLALLTILVCVSLGSSQRCLAQTGILQTVVSSFSCSNVPVAVAVRNLSAYSPVPLNIVVDVVPQPVVTVSYERAKIGDILKGLLVSLPEYVTIPTNGTILLLPKKPIGDNQSPLVRKLDRFSVVYRASVHLSGETNYVAEFYHTGQPELNVSFVGTLPVSEQAAKQGPIPRARAFEGMNLIAILTVLSKEEHQSWSLSRVWPEWVEKNNKEYVEHNMGPSQWAHPEAPCYVVFWRPLPPNVTENPWYGP